MRRTCSSLSEDLVHEPHLAFAAFTSITTLANVSGNVSYANAASPRREGIEVSYLERAQAFRSFL